MYKNRQNKYFIRSRIREGKFREVLRCFCEDLNAKQSSNFTKLNINTINSIFKKLRIKILEECEKESPLLKGEVEVDTLRGTQRIVFWRKTSSRETRTGCWQKNSGLRIAQKKRESLHANCIQLLSCYIARDNSREGFSRVDHSQRWMEGIRRFS